MTDETISIEELTDETISVEDYQRVGEALKLVKKYTHILLAEIEYAGIDMNINELRDFDSFLINTGYDIRRQMEDDFPDKLELAYDFFQ